MNESKYQVFYDKEEYDDYLMHYGVKGQKWGVIRSYIKKGAKAVSKGAKKAATATRNQARSVAKKIKARRALSQEKKSAKANAKTSESAKVNKDTKSMSDKELESVIRRMEQEKRYRDVYNQLHPKDDSFKSRLSEAAKKGVESGVQTLISRQIPEIGSKYIQDLIADPQKKKQSQLNINKNIMETEAWIKEFKDTGKRPDWEIGKGPSAKKAEPDPLKQKQSKLSMEKNIMETEAWIKEFKDTGKRPDWEIGKGSGKQKSDQSQKPKEEASKEKPKEEAPKEKPKEEKPKQESKSKKDSSTKFTFKRKKKQEK